MEKKGDWVPDSQLMLVAILKMAIQSAFLIAEESGNLD